MTDEIVNKLRGIKFVYFDVGNVLLSFSEGLENLAQKFDKPIEKNQNLLDK